MSGQFYWKPESLGVSFWKEWLALLCNGFNAIAHTKPQHQKINHHACFVLC